RRESIAEATSRSAAAVARAGIGARRNSSRTRRGAVDFRGLTGGALCVQVTDARRHTHRVALSTTLQATGERDARLHRADPAAARAAVAALFGARGLRQSEQRESDDE